MASDDPEFESKAADILAKKYHPQLGLFLFRRVTVGGFRALSA